MNGIIRRSEVIDKAEDGGNAQAVDRSASATAVAEDVPGMMHLDRARAAGTCEFEH